MPNPMMQMLQRSGKSPNNPLAMLGEFRRFAAGMTPQELSEAGMVLPAYERLREAAVKRALWPQLRGVRRRP